MNLEKYRNNFKQDKRSVFNAVWEYRRINTLKSFAYTFLLPVSESNNIQKIAHPESSIN